MGNSPFSQIEKTAVVASADTWIEGRAVQQLEKTAELPGMIRAVGMPDLHPGRGYPIGAAFLSQECFYPALVGNDIGCGMSLWTTDLAARKAKPEKLARKLTGLDAPMDDDWSALVAEQMAARGLETTGFERSLGTIGGGNHFAEFQKVDEIFDLDTFSELGLNKNQLVLLVHSGSRGLGQQILTQHVEGFSHAGLEAGTPEADQYLERHNQALTFAELNRYLIARRFFDAVGTDGQQVLDVNHNLVEPVSLPQDSTGWLHRKGATPADRGLVMIPGSRGHASYLVKPKLEGGVRWDSLSSLAHGAGRKWIRSDCRERLEKRFRIDDLERTSLGSRVVCKDKALMFEEAPEAYKSIDSVIQAMLDADLIERVARFHPVVTYKTRGGC
jgi:release factor H-coupled RctB family protein